MGLNYSLPLSHPATWTRFSFLYFSFCWCCPGQVRACLFVCSDLTRTAHLACFEETLAPPRQNLTSPQAQKLVTLLFLLSPHVGI